MSVTTGSYEVTTTHGPLCPRVICGQLILSCVTSTSPGVEGSGGGGREGAKEGRREVEEKGRTVNRETKERGEDACGPGSTSCRLPLRWKAEKVCCVEDVESRG